MMLQRLIASRLVTSPAIWGKLRGHGDFVRSGMRHGESEGWEPWLAQQAKLASGDAADVAPRHCVLPASFVLPPGTLCFARRRFVIGVITPSLDRAGRSHALLVYQLAHPRWVRRYFEAQADAPHDWLFWLARSVARHTGDQGSQDIRALEQTVQALWRIHSPVLRDLWPGRPLTPRDSTARREQSQALLVQRVMPVAADDPVLALHGVRYLPWVDWPQRLHRSRAEPAFWQQDARGGFVGAANRLQTLWRGAA